MSLSKKKKKVYLHGRDNINWSIDSDRKHLENFLSKLDNIKITSNLLSTNIVHSVWYNQLDDWKKILIKNKYVIAHITNNIEDNLESLNKIAPYINLWIAANQKQIEYLEQNNFHYAYQPFYVDEKVFKNFNLSKEVLCQRLGIPYDIIKNKKIFLSIQRDSLGADLTKPKWQKNPDFLIEILLNYKKHNPDFILLLAGPRRHYIISKLTEYNIPFFFYGKAPDPNSDDIKANNLDSHKIALLYNLGDICIITSKSESGPKAILESCWCKLPVISTNVGLARDVISDEMLFSNAEEAIVLINKLDDPDFRISILDRNYSNMIDNFSYSRHLERWTDIYAKFED